jgi:hypothetical protein
MPRHKQSQLRTSTSEYVGGDKGRSHFGDGDIRSHPKANPSSVKIRCIFYRSTNEINRNRP